MSSIKVSRCPGPNDVDGWLAEVDLGWITVSCWEVEQDLAIRTCARLWREVSGVSQMEALCDTVKGPAIL